MRTGRSYVATAVALGIITLTGCAAESGDEGNTGINSGSPSDKSDDWGDPNKYPELGGKFAGLSAFNGTCTFTNGTMTVTTASGDQAFIVAKRAADSALVVNDALLTGCTTATASTVKQLKIVGSTGNQTVILDFLGGVFAPGIATARGIVIDLGTSASDADEVRIRGTVQADNWVFGSDGMAVNADAFRDIDFTNVESFNFSLAGGNDSLTGTVVTGGLGAGKGVTASATVGFTVFGGDGNDVITGGTRSDVIFGGPGADTLTGGGTGAGGESDTLMGQQGVDTIAQGADPNGQDIISCGTADPVNGATPDEQDVVTYALRGTTAARDATSGTTIAATDGERVKIVLGDCTDAVNNSTLVATPDNICDLDAYGNTLYGTNSGGGTEVDATHITVTENDHINADCEVVIGSMDNDIFVGSDPSLIGTGGGTGANNLQGGPGDDILAGGLGADILSGDADNDTLDESGADPSTGNNGGDVLNGGAGTDVVTYAGRSTAITVTMDGTSADDGTSSELDNVKADIENIIGTDQGDTITGNALDNIITGGLGADSLAGGVGNDTFNEGATSVSNHGDTFAGGAGIDTVDYSARTVAVWVTMDGAAADDGEGTVPTRTVSTQSLIVNLESVAATGGSSTEADNVGADVENVLGTSDADDITGNDLANTIEGGANADFIFGGDGDDTLFGAGAGGGTDGNDYLYGGDGNDRLDGGGGTANKLVCGAGEDISLNQGSVTFVPSTGVGAYRDVSCES